MKHNFDKNQTFKAFLIKKFNITEDQVDRIDQYCMTIKNWSERQNIVSRHDLDHLIEKHVIPSAFITEKIRDDSAKTIADVGSGSGFPGIIIKILLPQKSVHLVDSSRKKYLFLLEICELLKIDCQVINERIENVVPYVDSRFDIIVSRAVAPLPLVWAWSERSITETGSLFVLKGGSIDHEIEQIERMDLTVKIIRPDHEWQFLGEVLKNKFIACVRRNHGRR